MKKSKSSHATSFKISTSERPDFCGSTSAAIFDSAGNLLESCAINNGKLTTKLNTNLLKRAKLFIVPVEQKAAAKLTLESMNRLNAYQAVVAINGKLKELIQIPGGILDHWLFCSCYVQGQVLRKSDNAAICGARVHICEVDKVYLWIRRLPDNDLFKIRDDLLEIIHNPPKIGPKGPIPDPPPFTEAPIPLPSVDPVFRFNQAANSTPNLAYQKQQKSLRVNSTINKSSLSNELLTQLQTGSVSVLRELLASQWKLLYPWFCSWPWWRLRCDEMTYVDTDANGRFETTIFYPCAGDKPDLYFWVEYDLGNGFETVYRPLIGCHTYWNYQCGSEITLRVSDPRVPGCTDEPDLPGCQVLIKSIGNNVAIKEINSSSSGPMAEGLLNTGEAFGGTLEPRVGFSRSCLIDDKDIPYYRWSYRRLSGPDGVSTSASTPASEKISTVSNPANAPASDWTILTKEVVRHYKDGTSYPADIMGPMPTVGANPAPIGNLFRIRPVVSPSGDEWHVFDQHVDLATGYFETAALQGTPASGPVGNSTPAPEDLAAGRYELKLELFDAAGNLVNWSNQNIDLRITENDAPFGSATINTISAPEYNRIKNGAGDTIGFKMTVRVDNNHCFAEALPVEGDVTPDPVCGFHTYNPGDHVRLKFIAQHPNQLARYTFNTFRASGSALAIANTSGVTGEVGNNGYMNTGNFNYQKDIAVTGLLGSCANAAFAERLDVVPKVQNGYNTLHHLRHSDTAAFALAQPCPPCECDE